MSSVYKGPNKVSESIFAQATPQGVGALAVYRLSGVGAFDVLQKLTMSKPLPQIRQAALRTLRDPQDGQPIDEALVLCFKAPSSFTGEDIVEFHVHGSPAVGQKLTQVCLSFEGVRLAQAGEFSRRALANHKMDILEVEGLSDLLWAQTELQRQQAIHQYTGALSSRVGTWRQELMTILSELEAGMEFGEESDLLLTEYQLRQKKVLQRLNEEMIQAISSAEGAQLVRQGVEVVLFGAPNAGKSSFLNTLLQESAILVSDQAGTTRDTIAFDLDIKGYPVTFVDTAGIRLTTDHLEEQGIERAVQRLKKATVGCLLMDATDNFVEQNLKMAIDALGKEAALFLLWTKIDKRFPSEEQKKKVQTLIGHRPYKEIFLSVYQPETLEAFCQDLHESFLQKPVPSFQEAPLTRQHHKEKVKATQSILAEALTVEEEELLAAHLQEAMFHLGSLVGAVHPEDLLDQIFSTFCIGK